MIKADEIHTKLAEVLSPDQIDHWYGDLYAKVTPESRAIIAQYEFRKHVSTFFDQIDNKLWYEIPFAYDPQVKEGQK